MTLIFLEFFLFFELIKNGGHRMNARVFFSLILPDLQYILSGHVELVGIHCL